MYFFVTFPHICVWFQVNEPHGSVATLERMHFSVHTRLGIAPNIDSQVVKDFSFLLIPRWEHLFRGNDSHVSSATSLTLRRYKKVANSLVVILVYYKRRLVCYFHEHSSAQSQRYQAS